MRGPPSRRPQFGQAHEQTRSAVRLGRPARADRGLDPTATLWHVSRTEPPQAGTEKRHLLCRGASRKRASPVRFIRHRTAKCGAIAASAPERRTETDWVAEGRVWSEPVSRVKIPCYQG